MTTIPSLLAWLEALAPAQVIRESTWAFPAVESVHVIAVTLMVGSIMIVDLRLLGLTSRQKPVTELAREVLPWTWGLFGLAALAGGSLFISQAHTYFVSPPFRLKMLFLALAGLNMLVFHLTAYRSVKQWDHDRPTLLAAKIAGALSLFFWIGVVAFGRWIAFVDS